MKLYLAGPRTGHHDYNRAAFDTAATELRRKHHVTSPTELEGADEGMEPGGDGSPLPEDVYLRGLRKCIVAMLGCEAVVVIDGWEQSRGAVAESTVARMLGLPVLRYPDLRPVASERHPASERFHAVLSELGELQDRKMRDYGRADDPYANVRAASDWGMPAWVGAMVRATDKVRRLQTFARTGTLANEGVRDAFMDLSVYAVIALLLYEEESADTPPA